ncbi:hypothetical protein [Amycolatopsis balhimycina]|uniref:hypothetical protein n=1 Tax=Amycolatopsis balhimycina TaxID=208443 RepID=UPI001B7F9CE6|nr:hypothetical protein [Amycolatopsis balhimycina]
MALTGALCHTLLAATGFTNKNLRVLIAGLLGSDYDSRRPPGGGGDYGWNRARDVMTDPAARSPRRCARAR